MSYYNDPLNDPEHVRSLRRFFVLFLVVLAALWAILAWAGCAGTVTPRAVESSQASYDGNEQNSGVLGVAPGGNGYLITAHARDRYNALVAVYGRDFSPAVTRDAGCTALPDGTYLMDREHVVKFIEMNRWKKAGLAPVHN